MALLTARWFLQFLVELKDYVSLLGYCLLTPSVNTACNSTMVILHHPYPPRHTHTQTLASSKSPHCWLTATTNVNLTKKSAVVTFLTL